MYRNALRTASVLKTVSRGTVSRYAPQTAIDMNPC